jgi:predicted nucleotidyltransferase
MINEQLLISMITEDLCIESAYLLGSAAKSTMRPDSDVDVAILPVKGCTFNDLSRSKLAANLSFALNHSVDIGILSSSNLIYAKEAILTGRRIFTRNAFIADMAETTLLSMYACFNEERQEVINAYCA